jgi:phage tail sheath protein FI
LVTEDKRERLASLGINTLQAVRSSERLGMAPRTLGVGTAAAADWQLLAPRRLALFILNSVERGTRWTLFNDSSAHVARLVETQLREFFEELHGDGAFGMRPLEESFFISVPSASQMVIGFAAGRTGELHGFRIAHSITGSTVTPVSLNRLANRSATETGG